MYKQKKYDESIQYKNKFKMNSSCQMHHQDAACQYLPIWKVLAAASATGHDLHLQCYHSCHMHYQMQRVSAMAILCQQLMYTPPSPRGIFKAFTRICGIYAVHTITALYACMRPVHTIMHLSRPISSSCQPPLLPLLPTCNMYRSIKGNCMSPPTTTPLCNLFH